MRGRRLVAAHRIARCKAAAEHLPLAAEAGPQVEGEAACFERLAYRARGAPGGQRGAGPRQPRHRLEQRCGPHVRIAHGRKAVEVDRVGAERELRHEHGGIAQREREFDRAAFEHQAMQAGQRQRPLRGELLRQRRELRRRGLAQGLRGQRMTLDRDHVQARRPLRVGAPRGPGGEEVDAKAEAGFQHHELCSTAPTRRQVVAAEKDVARLPERTVSAGVDVAIVFAERHAVAPGQVRRRHAGGGAHLGASRRRSMPVRW